MTLAQPLTIPTSEGYEVVVDYAYEWEAKDRKFTIIVPKGFVFDGASVPRILWTLIGITPDGLHRAAALVHDFIYRYDGFLPNGSFWEIGMNCELIGLPGVRWNRDQADKLFARMLREGGVSKFKRRLMYQGVRLGGWIHWND